MVLDSQPPLTPETGSSADTSNQTQEKSLKEIKIKIRRTQRTIQRIIRVRTKLGVNRVTEGISRKRKLPQNAR